MKGRQDSARQRSGRNPLLLLWVFVAAAAMVLAGCGNLSLTSVLENESPGEFRLSPETVNLPVSTKFTFSATGGFAPYNYQVVAGLGTVAKDQTWVYQAPDTITGDYIEVTIQATDQLGDSDTATVWVFNPFSIVGRTWRIVQIPGSVTIEAAGGVPDKLGGYSWSVNGTVVATGTKSYPYSPTEAGIEAVGATDFLGNYVEATVIVLPELNAPLTIYPDSATVAQGSGNTVIFEAYGGKPGYSWTAVINPISPTTANAATYTATTAGTDTVTLTDSALPSAASVSATVTVTADPIPPLVLSPEGPTVKAIGDTVQFSASGGVPPLTFSSAPPGYIDSSGLYTQISSHKKVNVLVKDTTGASDVTTVYYSP